MFEKWKVKIKYGAIFEKKRRELAKIKNIKGIGDEIQFLQVIYHWKHVESFIYYKLLSELIELIYIQMKQVNQSSAPNCDANFEDECLICCDQKPNATTNSCQHRFCSTCLLRWSKSKRTCPICRKHYTGLKITKPILPKLHKKTIYKQKISIVKYELMCRNYINLQNGIIPVYQMVPMTYSFDTFFVL